ncbi:replication-associated protein [Plakobranchus ocellatus]|uniref:Replication-associated protein n=1 Tax=Plakobranchus ocellatus TaxID=259542 RepID=A0AAV4A6Y7_9GAST|nr:replication-associated protein [Plakobranchus ocellatus]
MSGNCFVSEKHISILTDMLVQAKTSARIGQELRETQWYTWPFLILRELARNPDQRSVIWFHEEVGNSGKTHLSKYIVAALNGISFENGKSNDIKYA